MRRNPNAFLDDPRMEDEKYDEDEFGRKKKKSTYKKEMENIFGY